MVVLSRDLFMGVSPPHGDDTGERTQPHSGEFTASWRQRLTWGWLGDIIKTARGKALQESDLYALCEGDTAAVVTHRLFAAWSAELDTRRGGLPPRLWRALGVAFGAEWLHAGLPLKTAWLGLVLAQVYAVRGLIVTLHSATPSAGAAAGWVLLLAGGVQGVSLCQHHIFTKCQRLGMRVRTALCGCVYETVLRLTAADMASRGLTSGSLNNMLLSDARRVEEAIVYSHFTWHAAIELVVIVGVACATAGVSALGGAAAMLLLVYITQSLARRVGQRRKVAIAATDVRVRLTKEVLTNARAVKLNGWVPPFAARLAAARAAEAVPLRGAAQFRAASSTIRDTAAPAAALATFGTLAALHGGGALSPARVFTVMALFNSVIRILGIAPMGLQAAAEASSAMARLSELLALHPGKAARDAHGEMQDVASNGGDVAADEAAFPVQLSGTFRWSQNQQQAGLPAMADLEEGSAHGPSGRLRDVSLRIARGSLTAVVGPVGSGKSSLLLALLGELHAEHASGTRGGAPAKPCRRVMPARVAYAPQEAWVMNATVRDNILLRRPYDAARYAAVLAACALERDLATLPGGDGTEVGERGVTLSGGQRARLSLARAVYAQADVYLIDDPISALDAPTARHVMQECLCGPLLKGSTRVLVTHARQWLHACDDVIVLDGGRVVLQGPPTAVSAAEPILRRSFDEEHAPKAAKVAEAADTVPGEPADAEAEAPSHALVVAEDRATGEVTAETYLTYCRAAGGPFTWLYILALYVAQAVASVATFLWLAYWADQKFPWLSVNQNVAIYASITGGAALLSLLRARSLTTASLAAACSLHDVVLERVLRSPIDFFDRNPVGRILNRFAKDLSTLDGELPVATQACGELFAQGLAGFITVSVILPFFTVVIPPAALCIKACYVRYAALSREAKRLDGVTRSPVVSHFGVTMAGAPCVRAFAAQEVFTAEFNSYLDGNNRAFWVFITAGRWLGVRLDCLAAVAAGVAGACVVGARYGNPPGRLAGTFLPPGLAGMALVASLTFAGTLQYATRQLSELENAMTSVERLVSYAHLEGEAAAETPQGVLPPGGIGAWPSAGRVDFESVTVRYSPKLEPTLRGISFTIQPGHMVGICGRTGAGKSTLVSALFRLVENSGCTGRILIDGIDIAAVGLDDLRRAVSLIPQEAVLFQGTLRDNLDPFGACSELAIAAMVPRLGLHTRAGSAGLACQVSEAGDNWSAGERQLVCLGRALLRSSRLLVCDEATANVDAAADARIQAALRLDFAGCTVLTVAHRLDTVIGSDRVAVLVPGGTLAQYGEPHELLAGGQGGGAANVFADMVDATGKTHAAVLREAARQAHLARKKL